MVYPVSWEVLDPLVSCEPAAYVCRGHPYHQSWYRDKLLSQKGAFTKGTTEWSLRRIYPGQLYPEKAERVTHGCVHVELNVLFFRMFSCIICIDMNDSKDCYCCYCEIVLLYNWEHSSWSIPWTPLLVSPYFLVFLFPDRRWGAELRDARLGWMFTQKGKWPPIITCNHPAFMRDLNLTAITTVTINNHKDCIKNKSD